MIAAPEDLRAAMDEALPSSAFTSVGIAATTPRQREILTEDGFPGDFPVCASLRLDKFDRQNAIQGLHRLHDRLGADKSRFVFQNETEPPLPRQCS